MVNKQNKNNKTLLPKEIIEEYNKEISSKVKGFKMRMNDDGIILIDWENVEWSDKNLDVMMDINEKYQGKMPADLKTLIKVGRVFRVPPLSLRRKIAKVMKGTSDAVKFKKQAICGGGAVSRVVISFILKAARFKNIKYFKTEKEALKWLKEE